jgi:hypothetical protein
MRLRPQWIIVIISIGGGLVFGMLLARRLQGIPDELARSAKTQRTVSAFASALGDAAAARKVLQGLGVTKYYDDLAKYFPPTPAGRATALLATLSFEHSNVRSPAGKLADAQYEELRRRPTEAFAAIKEGLQAMPTTEFADKRQYLLLFASRQLDIEQRQKLDLLMSEAKRTPSMEKDREVSAIQAAATPMVAIESAFELVKFDPSKSESMLQDALAAHQGRPEVQRALVISFARVDQDRAHAIETKLGLTQN